MESNYALYREQAKKMNPNMDEKDIYSNWHELAFGKWAVQKYPVVGYDGNYHYLYLSERDDGKIYIGRHSTGNLDDGYVGSGTEVVESVKKGHTFKKTVLEYFKNSNASYDEEKKVVNNRMLNESHDMVLNRSLGGRNYVAPTINVESKQHETPKTSKVENEHPVSWETTKKNQEFFKECTKIANGNQSYSPTKGSTKPRYYTFTMLGAKPGDEITFIDNDNIVCRVNDDRTVTYNGQTYSLFALAKKVSDIYFKNALDVWKFKGKILSKIRDEIMK